MRPWHFFLLLLGRGLGFMQLIDTQHSLVLLPTSTPPTFSSTGEDLYSLPASDSYSLFTWVRIRVLPGAGQLLAELTSDSSVLFQLRKEATGQWTLTTADIVGNSHPLSVSGGTSPQWVHIAASTCSSTLQVFLAVTLWQGSTVSVSVLSQTSFKQYDPEVSVLVLGGATGSVMNVRSTQGEFLNTQFETGTCRDLSAVAAIVSTAQCYSKCQSSCFGPGDKACNDYIQLLSEVTATVGTGNYFKWGRDDPHLMGHTFGSLDYTHIGWYYDAENIRVWRNYFRSQNKPGDYCEGVEQRIMGVYRQNNAYIWPVADTSTICDYNFPAVLINLNTWFFTAFAACHGTYIYCTGYPTDATLACSTSTASGSPLAWGTSVNSALFIGDPYYGGIGGKLGDHRYYFQTCLSVAQLNTIFNDRKAYCTLRCNVCATPFECSTCASGSYLSPTKTCEVCNSCCSACSGPGDTACTGCAPGCQALSPTTCVSKVHLECHSTCLVCTGVRYWSCATCVTGYKLQPHSSQLCLLTCPSGFSPINNICVGADSIVMDYIFDRITPAIEGVVGTFACNGASLDYMEPSDPVPSKHRGYYFKGAQYLQLPPANDASGPPLIFPTSFSIVTWIRPQGSGIRTIYSKGINAQSIFEIRLTSTHSIEFISNSVSYTHSMVLTSDLWVFVGVSFDFSGVTGLTTVRYYYDGTLHATSFTSRFYVKDESTTATQTIGASPSLANFYTGFIWRVAIANYVAPTLLSSIKSQGCPASLSYCLSPCPFLQTITCEACGLSCVNGCVRTTDCSLCFEERCEQCRDFEAGSCTQCIPNAEMTPQCQCTSNHFYRSRECVQCAPECKECDSDTTYSCLACYSPAVLSSKQCKCADTYFPSPNAGSCQPCAGLCLTCSNVALCQSCKSHSHLIGSSCVCDEGFHLSDSVCEACGYACAECDYACIRCFSGFYLLDGKCSEACPEEYRKDPATGTCVRLVPFTAALEVSTSTELQLTFSSKLAAELHRDDLFLSLLNADNKSEDFEFEVAVSIANLQYFLVLAYQDTESDHLKATLDFVSTDIVDEGENPLETTELTVNISLPTPPTDSLPLPPPPLSAAGAAAAQSSAITGITGSFMSGSPTTLFTMMNNIQLLNYLPLSSVPMSQDLRGLLSSLNMQSFIPNPFLYWLESDAGPTPPDFALSYGYDSCVLLVNVGVNIMMGISVLLSSLCIKFMSKFPEPRVALLFSVYFEKIQWSGIVRYWIQAYLDVALASGLQLQRVLSTQLSFSSPALGINSVLSIVLSLLCAATPFLCLAVTLQRYDQPIQGTWKSLFDEFKHEKDPRSSLYYSVFLLRRLFFAVALLFLSGWPKLQSATFFAHSLTVRKTQALSYLLLFSPFQSKLDQISSVTAEVCITLVFTLSFAFNYSLPDTIDKGLTATCFICVYATMVVSNVVTVISSVKILRTLYSAYKRALANIKKRKRFFTFRRRSKVPQIALHTNR